MFLIFTEETFDDFAGNSVGEGKSLADAKEQMSDLEPGKYVVLQVVAKPSIEIPEPKRRVTFESTRKRAPRSTPAADDFETPATTPKKSTSKRKAV